MTAQRLRLSGAGKQIKLIIYQHKTRGSHKKFGVLQLHGGSVRKRQIAVEFQRVFLLFHTGFQSNYLVMKIKGMTVGSGFEETARAPFDEPVVKGAGVERDLGDGVFFIPQLVQQPLQQQPVIYREKLPFMSGAAEHVS